MYENFKRFEDEQNFSIHFRNAIMQAANDKAALGRNVRINVFMSNTD